MGEELGEGPVPLAWLWAGFQLLTLLPTGKLGPPGADSWVGGFVYVLGPWEFLEPEVLRLFFSHAGTLGCVVCLAPQLFLLVYPHSNVGPPACQLAASLTQSSSCRLATCPFCPGYPSPLLLPVWLKVSSLTP